MSEQWQKDLTVANRTGVHKVMELWHRWQSEGVPDGAALEVAAILIGMFRHKEALEILKTLGDDLQVRQQYALVLAKSGRVDDAIEVLEGLKADGHDDTETLGILAGRYRQRALAAGGEGTDLQTAYNIYLEAYEDTKDTYPGINAASLALELEDPDEGSRIATEIVEQLVEVPRAEMDHWQFATLGEAYLLLDNLEDATRWYRKAVAANPNAVENIATIRRQARRNLENLKQTVDALDKVLTVRGVVAFTGHMVDRPGRAEPRFPQDHVGDVRLAVREKLKAHGAGFGVSSAAAGSDLLFLEEMLERGGHAEVILPFPEADFIQTSVHEWEDRFHKVLEDPRVSVTILADGRPPDEELEAAFQACNARLLDRAKEIGKSLDEEPVLLAVPSQGDRQVPGRGARAAGSVGWQAR